MSFYHSIEIFSNQIIAKHFFLTKCHFFFQKPGHRVPRLSMINFGLCVPSTCSHTDVEQSLIEYVEEFTTQTSIQYKLRVDPGMCYTKTAKPLETNTRLAMWVINCCSIHNIYIIRAMYDSHINTRRIRHIVSFQWFFCIYCRNSRFFNIDRDARESAK